MRRWLVLLCLLLVLGCGIFETGGQEPGGSDEPGKTEEFHPG
jgi:hypothetical protein|nr:MAG: hypothetical protein KatS3mg041_1790 [Bacteroidota bacterium]